MLSASALLAPVTEGGCKRLLRVASVPECHVYVRHLSHPGTSDSVVRLADPIPVGGRRVPGQWWPAAMLDAAWIERNHAEFDVFHVHFGFDALGPEVLTDIVQALKMHDKPLVYTVHDLRNPHHPDPTDHVEQQDVLIPAAHALITLTPGAADVIERRWGRRALVLPHPHVLERDRIERPRPDAEGFVVGVHVKSLRANMDPLPVLDALASTVPQLSDAVLQINMHDEIFDPDNHWYAPRLGPALLAYDKFDRVEVRRHSLFSDDELWDYLSALSVSVLPYRFGTHSGWLEACFDLGTAVIAPSCGFYAQQRQARSFTYTEERFDADSLADAVRAEHARWLSGAPAPRASWNERQSERIGLARAHRAVYESAVA